MYSDRHLMHWPGLEFQARGSAGHDRNGEWRRATKPANDFRRQRRELGGWRGVRVSVEEGVGYESGGIGELG